MSLRDDYRPTIMVLVGTLMSEAIRITGTGVLHVHVEYDGNCDMCSMRVYRASASGCWRQTRNQKIFDDHFWLSPFVTSDPLSDKLCWESIVANLNRWHDYLQDLQRQIAA